MRRAAVLLALSASLALACLHDPGRGPADGGERQRAEVAACFADTWPAWLDDQALADSARLDRWGATAVNPNESFRDSTIAAAPPPPRPRPADTSGSSRYAALLEERQQFQQRCALLRASGPGPGLMPVK